jgi:hypothetical protein
MQRAIIITFRKKRSTDKNHMIDFGSHGILVIPAMNIFRLRSFVKPYLLQIFLSALNLAALTALGLYVPRCD